MTSHATMPKFYATLDADEGVISEHAEIRAFDTRAEAEDYLLSAFDDGDFRVETRPGRFADCWIKSSSAPSDAIDAGPFALDDLSIRAPGEHPGGHAWWLEPTAAVLVADACAK